MTDVSLIDPPFAAPPELEPPEAVVFEVLGEPKGKGRPRFVRATGHTYTPAKTRNYEALLRHEAALAMAGAPPIQQPVRINIVAYFGIPASWSQKKRSAAQLGIIQPTVKPDIDNIAKLLDALNQVVFVDDRQIISAQIQKKYSEKPRLFVQVQAV